MAKTIIKKVEVKFGSDHVETVNEKGIIFREYVDGFGRTIRTLGDESGLNIETTYELNKAKERAHIFMQALVLIGSPARTRTADLVINSHFFR